MSVTYSANEQFDIIPEAAFLNALQDANMLMPGGSPTPAVALFPNYLYSIRLGGDASMVGSNSQVVLPIASTDITIGKAYGTVKGYAGDSNKDSCLWIPFSVWTNTGSTQDDTEQRLNFARSNRNNVFESHGLVLYNGTLAGKPRGNSPITGLDVIDYRWYFQYTFGVSTGL